MLGVFAAQDLILFYVFFEITLIPMYLLVGIWGDENRRPAAIKFFIYTFLGSTVMLAGFLAFGILAGSFAMDALTAGGGLSRTAQIAIAAPILFGLLVKVPAVPLHSWLLDVYVSSPISTNVVLSGVLPKLGTYGLIRVAIPLLPRGGRAVPAFRGGVRGNKHNLRLVRGVLATGPEGAGGLLVHRHSGLYPARRGLGERGRA